MADDVYTLNNKTDYTLKFDKTWEAVENCDVDNKTNGDINRGDAIKFDIDENNYDRGCTWGGVGYKVYSGSNYVDYLSVNVSSAGKDKWNYSYTFKGKTRNLMGKSGDFVG